MTRRMLLTARRLISPPAALGYVPSFKSYIVGSAYRDDFNFDARKPAFTRTIFCGPGGTNTNTGLTYPLRVRSIKVAISKANAFTGETVQLLIDPATYKSSQVVSGNADNWNGFNPTVDLVIEPNGTGKIISLSDTALLQSFALVSGGIYKVPYTTELVSRSMIDSTKLDKYGNPSRVWPVFTAANVLDPSAELNAAWAANGYGASFVDTTNKVLWVRLWDDRAPDASFTVLNGSANGNLSNTSGANRTIWMREIQFYGGNSPFKTTSALAMAPTILAQRCAFNYGNGTNGYNWASGGGTSFLEQCLACWNEQDGFNYHGASTTTASPTFHEFDCRSLKNGFDGSGSNNGTTSHDICIGYRRGGAYEDAADRAVCDINSAKTWNLGLTANSRRGLDATENSAAFAAGTGAATTSKMFLDGCKVSPGMPQQFPFESYSGCQILYTRMGPIAPPAGNPGAGTFTPY